MTHWPPDDPALPIIRYLTGELTEREEVELLRALERDPEQRRLYEELRGMWERSGVPRHEWDAYTALERIKRGRRGGIGTGTGTGAGAGTGTRIGTGAGRAPLHVLPPRRVWTPLRIAAAVAVLLGAGVIWRIAGAPFAVQDVTQPAVREFSTPRGQRATFQLSDGTRLILAADSRLRVPVDYGRDLREVYLEGEALFDVVHDAARPFRVRAKDAVAEDIGTRFDVRAYAEDSAVAVAVAEGAVALGPAEAPRATGRSTGGRSSGEVPQGVVLRQGEVGTLASDGRMTTATGDVVAAYLAWAEGRLRFVRTPLTEVARTVSRWYDLDVRVEGRALASLPITAEFGVQSADELLRELALAADARVKRSGKVVILQSKS